ncbi:MAG: hypothetical protein ABIH17_08490 [Pseudomonadota bacterium]
MTMRLSHALSIPVVLLTCAVASTAAQQTARATSQTAASGTAAAAAPVLPPGYVIGPADVLSILFWRDKDVSGLKSYWLLFVTAPGPTGLFRCDSPRCFLSAFVKLIVLRRADRPNYSATHLSKREP